MTDYPAAHSMDATWYAVDAVGHVALFETGPDGHAPTAAENANPLDDLFRARHPDAGPLDDPDDAALAAEFGFYLYDYGDLFDPIDVYHRRFVPADPVHVDQLPPEVRSWCKNLRLPITFADAGRFQPLEVFECVWWDEEERAGYVAGDGVTVRPLPGRGHLFFELVRRLRAEDPEAASRYRFEGVDDGP